MIESEKPILASRTPVQVRCRYDGSWADGFEVSSADPAAHSYTLRRRSDGVELPTCFGVQDVRPA